ncbi:hypothetical protein B0H65DRAFT_444962 [Neurospora tetraspora]|uniref:Uncharacterized protein n=1 Tax=Neurospora tetraspora TaxID=94610 RepID=A0AAE0JBP8_9PEZI|nr:hypothetical protein B0H65DRAFT_444962 [Neurospora tetraspora]
MSFLAAPDPLLAGCPFLCPCHGQQLNQNPRANRFSCFHRCRAICAIPTNPQCDAMRCPVPSKTIPKEPPLAPEPHHQQTNSRYQPAEHRYRCNTKSRLGIWFLVFPFLEHAPGAILRLPS